MKPSPAKSLIGALILFLGACLPAKTGSKPPGEPEPQTKGSQAKESQTLAPAPPPVLKKVEGKDLKVFSISLTPLLNGNKYGFSLGYNPDGKAEYVDYMICPLEDTGAKCPENAPCAAGGKCFNQLTSYNRVRLPVLYKGEVLVKVKACVSRERALGAENCGEEATKTYNSGAYDPQIASLRWNAERVKQQLRALIQTEYVTAMKEFVSEAQACDVGSAANREYLNAKVRVVQQFVYAPESYAAQAGINIGDAVLGEKGGEQFFGQIGEIGESFNRTTQDICRELGKSTIIHKDKAICETVDKGRKECLEAGLLSKAECERKNHPHNCSFDLCSVLEFGAMFAKGMVMQFDPAIPIGTISNTLNDAIEGTWGDRKKLVAKACAAEDNFDLKSQAITDKIEKATKELKAIREQLEAKGAL